MAKVLMRRVQNFRRFDSGRPPEIVGIEFDSFGFFAPSSRSPRRSYTRAISSLLAWISLFITSTPRSSSFGSLGRRIDLFSVENLITGAGLAHTSHHHPTYCLTLRGFRRVKSTGLLDTCGLRYHVFIHHIQTGALCAISLRMPNRLHRYYGAGYLALYHDQLLSATRALLGSRKNRDLFLKVLEQVRRRYRFVVCRLRGHARARASALRRTGASQSIGRDASSETGLCAAVAARSFRSPRSRARSSAKANCGTRLSSPATSGSAASTTLVVFSEKKRVAPRSCVICTAIR